MKAKKKFLLFACILCAFTIFSVLTSCDNQNENTTLEENNIITSSVILEDTSTLSSMQITDNSSTESINDTSNYGGLIDEGIYPR